MAVLGEKPMTIDTFKACLAGFARAPGPGSDAALELGPERLNDLGNRPLHWTQPWRQHFSQ